MRKREIELLAPAGSYESLLAALKSGADAVYVGGNKFGARAYANNFGEEELKRAIDLVHLNGKKLFLTINTLLKEKELMDELYDYIYPLYIHGLDAVIVQDFGVLSFVKEHFPDLPIHASTQMTVTSEYGLRMLEELGVERVVTSRELSLQEVKSITEQTDLEIESFVHGALCYGYSGQCVYSSLIGGRSGNRGQCAQPCRLPYEVNGKSGHFMSLKDICTLEHVDKLIESGVYSFKIEGRMKKPEYVASVTTMYRKYIDLYQKTGKVNVTKEDMDILKDVFSRGEFSTGYWETKNGPDMVTFDKPSHTGVPLLEATKQVGNTLYAKVLRPLNKGDIIDIPKSNDNYTFGTDYKAGQSIELNLRKGTKVKIGAVLFRTRNNSLLEKIDHELSENKLQQGIKAKAIFKLGVEASYTLELNNEMVTVKGNVIEGAQNQAATKEQVKKQLNKMGTSPFYLEELDIEIEDGLFIPVQILKELRRSAVEVLENQIVEAYRRSKNSITKLSNSFSLGEKSVDKNKDYEQKYTLYIENQSQIIEVIKGHTFDRVYINYEVLNSLSDDNLNKYIDQLQVPVYIALPHILRQKNIKQFDNQYKKIEKLNINGLLVRNIECYQYLVEKQSDLEIILDHHIHLYSNYTRDFWLSKGAKVVSSSPELTGNELALINHKDTELSIYGHATMMLSAQCIQKTTNSCTHKTGFLDMKDRMNAHFAVKNSCQYCYNVIYNNLPTYLLDEDEALDRIKPEYLRTTLSIENEEETRLVLTRIKDYMNGIKREAPECTLGNFRRGIK